MFLERKGYAILMNVQNQFSRPLSDDTVKDTAAAAILLFELYMHFILCCDQVFDSVLKQVSPSF